MHRLQDGRGMTLVEVLVAVAILGGALLSLCSLFVFGIKNNAAAKHDTVMATHIQDKLEELKQKDLGYLYSVRDNPSIASKEYYVDGAWKYEAELAEGDFIEYRREWAVANRTLLPSPEYNKSSTDFNNTVLEVTVTCYAYQYKKDTELRFVEIKTFRRVS